MAKLVLPLFGGSASIWVTCVLFFQTVLLAGYVYAHLLATKASLRTQFVVHGILVLAAFIFLPIRFNSPGSISDFPAISILLKLLTCAGLPFFVVSTTAPLVQHWLSLTTLESAPNPFVLYAAGSSGSIGALLMYPLFFEPLIGNRTQTELWTAGYGVLIVLTCWTAALVLKHFAVKPRYTNSSTLRSKYSGVPTLKLRLSWLIAAFIPSALTLAVTNHITMNIISVPFLWVLPLAVYLFTFTITFANSIQASVTRYATLSRWSPFILVATLPIISDFGAQTPAWNTALIAGNLLILFFGAYTCHTFLAARRPDPKDLTDFYFFIALGGAMGGAFVAIVAPRIFDSIFEYPLLLAALPFFRTSLLRKKRLRFAIAFSVLLLAYISFQRPKYLENSQVEHVARNFFGLKRVVFDPAINVRKLYHGDTLHGVESIDPALDAEPLTYYHRSSPAADAIESIGNRSHQNVGVIGLGVGSMAAYASDSRHIHFFEVDPQVAFMAREYFNHLRHCGVNCDVTIQDGRIALAKMPVSTFDLIMVDAFNSDSIPPHLVSREGLQMYLAKLKPDGLLLFHTSSRYFDVSKLVAAAVLDANMVGYFRRSFDDHFPFKASSDYIVAARHTEDLGSLLKKPDWLHLNTEIDFVPWTDDYSNMMSLVRWW